MRTQRTALGETIRRVREQKQLTQEFVAAAIGASQGYYSKIETGIADYSLSLLQAIAATLEIPLYELLALADGVVLEGRKKLTSDEAAVLADYRQLAPDGKNMVRAVVDTLSASRKQPTKR